MLKQRIITALVALVGLMIVLFVVPPVVAGIVMAAAILLGAWEWSGLLKVSALMLRVVYVVGIGVLILIAAVPLAASTSEILVVALVFWFCALLWTFFFPTPVPSIVSWLAGAFVLVPLFLALVLLYRASPEILLFALLIVWVADSGAYFAGKMFGRVKLAPSISPGKTWEGVIGGLVAVVLVTIGGSLWLQARFGTDLNIAVLVPFFIAVACLSIVGDLTVSMFKRNAGVKDSGTLFPGHGGILDRVDSVASAGPLVALGLGWAGLR